MVYRIVSMEQMNTSVVIVPNTILHGFMNMYNVVYQRS